MSTVPLSVRDAIALGGLAARYRGYLTALVVERHVHTGRVTVAIGGHDWELIERYEQAEEAGRRGG